MSEEYLQHLFEPFTQEHIDARSVYTGSGLGMSIVKALIDKMNGTISVTSKEGEGSIKGLHLLLVEDNKLNAEIAELLLSDEVALVATVSDGQQAVELFNNSQKGTFDAILMDIMMPVMDGIKSRFLSSMSHEIKTPMNAIIGMSEVALRQNMSDELRKYTDTGQGIRTEDIDKLFTMYTQFNIEKKYEKEGSTFSFTRPQKIAPIIAVTADAISGVRERLLSSGMNDYIVKPFKIHQICELIRKYLPPDKIEA